MLPCGGIRKPAKTNWLGKANGRSADLPMSPSSLFAKLAQDADEAVTQQARESLGQSSEASGARTIDWNRFLKEISEMGRVSQQ
jgi:hypothetical protein